MYVVPILPFGTNVMTTMKYDYIMYEGKTQTFKYCIFLLKVVILCCPLLDIQLFDFAVQALVCNYC